MSRSQPSESRSRTHPHHVSRGKKTLQSQLTEETFAEYCLGYEEITPVDLFKVSLGGRLRYITEDLNDQGDVIETKYRLGGILIAIDKDLRYCTLKNPYITPTANPKKGQFNKRTWSLQLRSPNTHVRLFYLAPASNDEVVAFRNLLREIDEGKIELKVKNKSKSKN